jgi:hypothetical protein
MNDFWDRTKREMRDAIRESGRPDLMLAIFSGLRLGFGHRVSVIRSCASEVVNAWSFPRYVLASRERKRKNVGPSTHVQ